MFLVKLQTAINCALVIEIGHNFYRFGLEFVPVENKQDKLGTSVTLPMQSAISSVVLFLVGLQSSS